MVKSEGRVVLLQSKIKIKEKGTDKREEIEQEKEKKKICKSIDKRNFFVGSSRLRPPPSQQDISLTVAFAVMAVGLPCFPHLPVTAVATDLTRVSHRTRAEFGVFRTSESALRNNKRSKKTKGYEREINRVAEDFKNIRPSGNSSSSKAHRCGIWKQISGRPEEKNLMTLENEGRKITSYFREKEREINRLSL
ncbi:hypothetical protein G5I_06350 [Acromyrmex echinatior]|uniref:Uncharacterized protein n=1 Tax=Acromyrmex echinatior TaxID=103372 RepID=F4WKT0_ACREC|nr:hypothetical protein G5I_06350 [Acromyrmex echinatior]